MKKEEWILNFPSPEAFIRSLEQTQVLYDFVLRL